jgi:hypothetical protein
MVTMRLDFAFREKRNGGSLMTIDTLKLVEVFLENVLRDNGDLALIGGDRQFVGFLSG